MAFPGLEGELNAAPEGAEGRIIRAQLLGIREPDVIRREQVRARQGNRDVAQLHRALRDRVGDAGVAQLDEGAVAVPQRVRLVVVRVLLRGEARHRRVLLAARRPGDFPVQEGLGDGRVGHQRLVQRGIQEVDGDTGHALEVRKDLEALPAGVEAEAEGRA